MATLTVNGRSLSVEADPQTPLLWALREHLGLTGTKFGCGAGLCGACTVHLDGEAIFACQTPLEAAKGHAITTIEGLSPAGEHPVQRAWVHEQVPQCGYCQPGQIMRAAALLAANPHPTRDEIIEAMSSNLCRCGTYPRIMRAIERAAAEG
jgi:isoquinoline 1-oxidoreductase alpha subunit